MIQNILQRKGRDVFAVSPLESLKVAAEKMAAHGVAALFILDGRGLSGLISEREIIRTIASQGERALAMPVGKVMQKSPPTVEPTDSLRHAMQKMTRSRARHLAVVEGADVIGVVSIGDVVKSRLEDLETEANVLRDVYIAAAH
jgi:CBS domain-containing protein